MAKAYHYTLFCNAVQILQTEVINLSVPSPGSGKLTAAWFSTEDQFEPGMGTLFVHPVTGDSKVLTKEEMARKIGLARFQTDTAFLRRLEDVLAHDPALWNRYFYGAKDIGSDALKWYVTLLDFPIRGRCTGAQLYLNGQWVEMTPATILQMSATLPNEVGATADDVMGG